MSTKEPTPGPYESTTTKVIELSNIKFTVTETVKSTHVPAPECGCGGGGLDLLMPLISQAAEALSKPAGYDNAVAPLPDHLKPTE